MSEGSSFDDEGLRGPPARERRVLRSSDWSGGSAGERSARKRKRARRSTAEHDQKELSTVRELLSGEYEVERRLSHSSVSLSFEAERAGRRGTVLVLPVDCEDEPARVAAFERSAAELRTLDHPGVIPLRDFGVRHDVPYLEYAPLGGRTLAEQLSLGPVKRERALTITLELLDTLAFVHSRELTHGCINPANVVILPDGSIRLLATGVAWLVREAGGSPRDGSIADRYVAPEVRKAGQSGAWPAPHLPGPGARAWDGRADVYSVGALLYHMITDDVPPPPPAVSTFVGHPLLPPDLEPLFLKALAMDPAGRFQTVEEMAEEVRDALGSGRAVGSVRPPPMDERLTTEPGLSGPGSRARWLAALGGATAVAAAVGVALGIAGGATEPEPVELARVPAVEPEPAATAVGPELAATASADRADEPEDAVPAGVEAAPSERTDAPAVETTPYMTDLPRELEATWTRVLRGERLARPEIARLYAFARRNPDDARPHLLMAEAFMELGWYSDAVERYRTAYSIDPASRAHPTMLENLMLLTFNGWVSEDAVYTVEEIFGAEARPAVEAALASDPPEAARARLERLRERLALRDSNS